MAFKKVLSKYQVKLKGISKKLSKSSKRNIRIALLIILAGALGYLAKPLIFAASVNGRFITRIELIRELEKQGGADVLDNLITKALIFQEGKNRGIGVTEDEVNTEITRIEGVVSAQGTSLDEALMLQGQTRGDFLEQIKLQKTVEKLLAEKIVVTDEEVKKYYDENKQLFGEDSKFEDVSDKVKSQLMQEKLSGEYQSWIAELRKNAKLNYFVNFKS